MRLYSWNVNGLRAVARKGVVPWQVLEGADVIALQEIKCKPSQLTNELFAPAGWYAFWHSAERPGYSGVAMFSRSKPDEIVEGVGDSRFDCEGRVLSLRFGDLVAVGAYFPNSQEAGARLAYKLAFCTAMEEHLARWRARGAEPVLLGDYNIAHQPIDLARPKENEESPGYLPEERAWFARYLGLGYRDVFRERNPDRPGLYTWWTMRTFARERNVGWRIDYATVSDPLASRVRGAEIHPQITGSDHCPVSVDLA